MYKPQRAHYESIRGGVDALRQLIYYIHSYYPGIPVFLDCKRGDIGRTQERYGIAQLELDSADGMNFSPYMGSDCLTSLAKAAGSEKALVGLCYTSNPAAREVQDIMLANGMRYWEFIAERTLSWANLAGVLENAGLVMAAAYEFPKGSGEVYSEHLTRCREIVGDQLWFLIPGIGTQGGFVEETVRSAYSGWGSIAINSSSGITFASDGDDFAEAAACKAEELRDQIRVAMGR
jgi:orotidine-5'-phosphate decarboxylase